MSSFCKTFKKVNDCRWSQLRINNLLLILNQFELSSFNVDEAD